MTEFPRWKYALVALVIALGLLYALPNIFPKQPAVQISANRGATVDAALKETVQGELEKQKLAFKQVELDGDRLLVRFADTVSQTSGADALRTSLGENYNVALNLASTVPNWLRAIHADSMPLGLDLQGGVHFLMQVDQSAVTEKQDARAASDIGQLLKDKKFDGYKVTRSAQGVSGWWRTSNATRYQPNPASLGPWSRHRSGRRRGSQGWGVPSSGAGASLFRKDAC